jgi:hypothetical protein
VHTIDVTRRGTQRHQQHLVTFRLIVKPLGLSCKAHKREVCAETARACCSCMLLPGPLLGPDTNPGSPSHLVLEDVSQHPCGDGHGNAARPEGGWP